MARAAVELTAGFILVDKPVGPSSHKAVQTVRFALGVGGRRGKKAGHAGTLDPFASGLLVVLLGRATRLMPYVVGHDKRYLVGIRFGASSDTDDIAGELTLDAAPAPERADVEHALAELALATEQIPPSISALHVDGERAHRRVRAGETVELPARPIRFDAVKLIEWQEPQNDETGPRIVLDVRCGTGTYMRALARDLGRAVGCAAHCEDLRRTEVGEWLVEAATEPLLVEPGHIHDPARLLQGIPLETLADEAHLASIIDGRSVEVAAPLGMVALLAPDSTLAAIAEVREDGRAHPRTVIAPDHRP